MRNKRLREASVLNAGTGLRHPAVVSSQEVSQVCRFIVPTAVVFLLLSGSPRPGAAEQPVKFGNGRFRIEIGRDGCWRGLTDKQAARNLLADQAGAFPLARAVIAGNRVAVNGIAFRPGAPEILRLHFPPDTTLEYRVQVGPDWIVFRLVGVSGPRPEKLTLLRLPVAISATVGTLLDCAYDERSAVCLATADLRVSAGARGRGGWTELRAVSQDTPGPRLEGAAAALIVCPPDSLPGLLAGVSRDFALPTNEKNGKPAREWPAVRQSYWFLSFGEKDVDRVIALCRKSGFRQVMLSFGAWSTSAGHYPINRRNFPDGLPDLQRTVRRLHGAGILVGMHTFASKVAKRDPYVTPVPDKRFWKDRQVTLADDVSPDQVAIRVRESLAQWPGSPVCRQKSWEGGVTKHMEVILDDEIVQYRAIGPVGRYDTFLGCRRGAWKTRPAAHKGGAPAFHYGVDGCINGYIIDQETSLLDEVATRLAGIFDACDFDMIYFDGGEDVDRRRFDYYVTRHQVAVMNRIRKRPVIHMGTIPTHRLWHSFARTGTVDTWPSTLGGRLIARQGRALVRQVREVRDGFVHRSVLIERDGKTVPWRTVKEHIDHSVRRSSRFNASLMPAELGWFGIWPRRASSSGLQLDEAEYLMVKSLAWDMPISFQTSFRQMEEHPLTSQILEIARTYEALRLRGPPLQMELRAKLRELGRDFMLVHNGGRREFVEVREVPMPGAAGDDARAFLGAAGTGSVLVLWSALWRPGVLELPPSATRPAVADFAGVPIPCEVRNGRFCIPVDNRRATLRFAGVAPTQVRALLTEADFEWRNPVNLWIQAEAFAEQAGRVATGTAAGQVEPDALGDFVLCTGAPQRSTRSPWFWQYAVNLPHEGVWTFWARVRYPTGTDLSFWLVPLAADGTEDAAAVLGNCGRNGKKWHWTGTGSGSTTAPPGRPITLRLPKGRFVFRIYPREGTGHVETNPRLDCFCLSDDRDYAPTDADARRAGLGSR
ncbi:MAG: hypothetical protein GXP31_03850 [Kiritimatiellaeota bacterium]|nr:hypothetical protein [Kiritimatiellota bacterium]